MNSTRLWTSCMVGMFIFLSSCESTETNDGCDRVPVELELSITDVSYQSISISGIASPSGCNPGVTDRGVVVSTTPFPTINDEKIPIPSADFSLVIVDRTPGTAYYIRPFLENSTGLFYGDQVEINTLTPDITFTVVGVVEGGIANGPEGALLYFGYEFTAGEQFQVNHVNFEVNGALLDPSLVFFPGPGETAVNGIIEDAENGTEYQFRPVVETEFGTFFGELRSFTMQSGINIVF